MAIGVWRVLILSSAMLVSAVYGLPGVYLSLGSRNITTNNTEILITDIGENAPGHLPSLTCHTDLVTCCRNMDTGGQGGLGEWYYPDGSVVPNVAAWENFYRVRNAPQVVRLARRRGFRPTGSFCCVIPTTGGEMTFCANLVPIITRPEALLTSNGNIVEGSVIQVYCSVEMNNNVSFTWTFNGSALLNDPPHIRIRTDKDGAGLTSVLTVDNFRDTDNGVYQCSAVSNTPMIMVFGNGTALTLVAKSNGTLMMVNQPSDNEPVDLSAIINDNRTGIALGGTVDGSLLTCTVGHQGDGGMNYPLPSVVWVRNGQVVDDTDSRITLHQTTMTNGQLSSSLTITNFTQSDVGVYQCVFTDNSDGGDSEVITTLPYCLDTGNIVRIERISPEVIILRPPEKLVIEVKSSGEYGVHFWRKNENIFGLSGNFPVTFPAEFPNFAEIFVRDNTTSDDEGVYRVSLNLRPGTEQTHSYWPLPGVDFAVIAPVDASTTALTTNTVVILEGGSADISCRSVGAPAPSITWELDNQTTSFEQTNTVTPFEASLTGTVGGQRDVNLTLGNIVSDLRIVNSRYPDHDGVYECIGTNADKLSHYNANSNAFVTVQVHVVPEVEITAAYTQVSLGDDLTLNCFVLRGNPTNYTYSIVSLNTMATTPGPTLVLTDIQQSDLGTYRCDVTNEAGTGSSSITIALRPICPRLILINGQVSYSSNSNPIPLFTVAILSCDLGHNLSGPGVTVCSDSGWSADLTNCQPVECGQLPAIKNGQAGLPTNTTFRGTVTYHCDDGFSVYGSDVVSCLDNGTWANPPMCLDAPPVFLTLNNVNYTTNNSEVLITDVGETSSSLTCHTNIVSCCRSIDTRGAPEGVWYYPQGAVIPGQSNGMPFYVSRDVRSVIRLKRRAGVVSPTGLYCCVIPTSVGEMKFCANLVMCRSLSPLENGTISYTPSNSPGGLNTVATYNTVCTKVGYRVVGDVVRTCQRNNTWSGVGPTCQPVNCGPLSRPPNGFVRTSSGSMFNSAATYSCNTGYELSGRVTRICGSDGLWTYSEPTCNAVDCGSPIAPVNGRVHVVSTVFQSTANYTCDTGYELHGVHTQTCGSDRQWTPAAPTCNPVDCGQLTAPINGQVTTSSGTTFRSLAVYSCATGYNVVGATNRVCGSNGYWSETSPTCVSVNCGQLTDPDHGRVDTQHGTTFNQVAIFSCSEGYNLIGSRTRTCLHDGQWSSSSPTCRLVDCGPLVNPVNGRVETSTGTTFNSVANYTCITCYKLWGSPTRTCGSDGIWIQTMPSCEIVDCGPLGDIEKGQFNTEPGTTCNSVASYSCIEGYRIEGSSRRTCTASGVWSPSAPSCIPIVCGALQDPDNGNVDMSHGTYFNSTATYSCDPGHNLTGSVVRVCQSNGVWSSTAPYCADNAMVQLKFGPTNHCIDWTESRAELMYKNLRGAIMKALHDKGYTVSMGKLQKGFFSCCSSTTETTYRTTITGTERVSAVEYAEGIQKWVESGARVRVMWYVVKMDKSCPVSIPSMEEDECE